MAGLLLKLAILLGVGVWTLVKVLRFASRFEGGIGRLASELLRTLKEMGLTLKRAVFWSMVIFLVFTVSRMVLMRHQAVVVPGEREHAEEVGR